MISQMRALIVLAVRSPPRGDRLGAGVRVPAVDPGLPVGAPAAVTDRSRPGDTATVGGWKIKPGHAADHRYRRYDRRALAALLAATLRRVNHAPRWTRLGRYDYPKAMVPFGDQNGTRWGLRDRNRGCPRNCKRRAARHRCHWRFVEPLGRRRKATTREPGDLPSPWSNAGASDGVCRREAGRDRVSGASHWSLSFALTASG
jgi:hypothetical protein